MFKATKKGKRRKNKERYLTEAPAAKGKGKEKTRK